MSRTAPVEKMTYVTVLGDGAGAIGRAGVASGTLRCGWWGARGAVRFVRALADPASAYLRARAARIRMWWWCVWSQRRAQSVGFGCGADGTWDAPPAGTLVLQGPPVPVEGLDMSLSHLERVIHDELRAGRSVGADRRGAGGDRFGSGGSGALITRRARLEDGVAMLRAAASPEQIRTIVDIAA